MKASGAARGSVEHGDGRVTRRRLLLPTAVLFIVAVLICAALLVSGAARLDQTMRVSEARAVRGLIDGASRHLTKLARDYTWWDAAIEHLVDHPDPKWADGNIGSYLADSYGLSASFVVAADGKPVIGFIGGKATKETVGDYVSKGLDGMIAAAEAGSMAKPEPVTGVVLAGGRLQFATVSPFTPEYPSAADLVRHDRAVLVLLRPAAAVFDATTAESFSLGGLAADVARPPSDRWSVRLASHDGTPLGWVSWRRDRPGLTLLAQVAVPLAIALFVGLIILWLAARNAGAVVRHDKTLQTLLDRERELRDLRSRFVATVSHRFRTPLATIQSAADIIGHYRDRMSGDELQGEVDAIVRAVDDLKMLMDKATMMDRAEAVVADSEIADVDVAGTVGTLWKELPGAITANRTLEISGEARLAVDRELFMLVIGNLLDNAARFSDVGGHVHVSIAEHPDSRLAIEVADDGIGIPEGEIEQIIAPFVRGSNVGARQGAGVGLAVVRHTLTRIGGTMMIQSEPGGGTRVTVDLPAEGAESTNNMRLAAQ